MRWDVARLGFSDLYSIKKEGTTRYLAGTNNHQIRSWPRSSVGAWEKWRFVYAGNNRFCIRSHAFNYYVRANGSGGTQAGYGCWAEELFEISCR